MTKLTNGLSKGAKDGLAAVARLALRNPRRRQMAIVICDCSKIVTDVETRLKEPTIRVLRLEPVVPEDVREVEKLYVRAIEAREGRQMLPLDLQVQLEEAFGKNYRIDPATGEIIVPDLEPPLPGDEAGAPGDGAPESQDDTAAAGADGGED